MTSTAPTVDGIRKATPADATAISFALADAFHTDPLFSWLVPDETVRATANREAFRLFVQELAPHDEIWTTSDGATAAALWVPHGQAPISEAREEEFFDQMLAVAGADPDRVAATFALLGEHHPTQPHEYLWFLGVIPSAQNQGIGSALLTPVLQRADQTRIPAYLEATSPRNRALYERHGFQASAPVRVAGGPPLWPMWREPA